LKVINALIHSNIFIALAAVSLTVETQIILGIKPIWESYLFIIFFATLFEYNLHRLIAVLNNSNELNSEKYRWVRENRKIFNLLTIASFFGLIVSAFSAKIEVVIVFAPLALLTIFYSVPVSKNQMQLLRLREIPYLKIFLIALVWSVSTILLPVIQSDLEFADSGIILLFIERFFFIIAIAIPFDIRDMKTDQESGLKTIPLLLNKKSAMALSYLSLLLYFLISFLHYQINNEWAFVIAISFSALSTYLFLRISCFKKLSNYYYGILDGTMFLQGLLVLLFFYLTCN
jgi:4-hydroxybenzoate polyprenyltransferase